MNALDRLLENPLVYHLWQSPFAADKIRPLLSKSDLRRVQKVLDVGCGPGTNSKLFEHADYVGVDINAAYIARARTRYRGRFVAADVVGWSANQHEQFDFILVNSILHHLDDGAVTRLLHSLSTLLGPAGRVHMLELVKPAVMGPAWVLAKLDRGRYARTPAEWEILFQKHLRLEYVHQYSVRFVGIPMWHMIYAVGAA